ncbi:afadin- and alpha-actinin-binding protein B isoform X3 [Sarcophilus harrisii]|uniref:afadin- and alpha-actinin-binding protein B isoform X3 n=1 Tax=Sarcophilus harrisii TaxID=9305 RepID=UPI001301C74A|nr:afadin- and alpha-actinin-binding protein B isoform X3 [Sarcophilus harrisii]
MEPPKCLTLSSDTKESWAFLPDCSKDSALGLEGYGTFFYEIIQQLYKDQLNLYMEKDKLKRAGELDSLRGRQSQLQAQVEMCKDKIAAVEVREQELLDQNQRLQYELDKEQEEVKRLQLLLTTQGTLYDHQLKKKEQELWKLKERVQVLGERRDKRASIDILNTLNWMDGKRTQWKADKADKKEGELLRTVVANLEQQVAEISQENKKMKQFLGQLDRDVINLLNFPQSDPSDDNGEGAAVDNGDIIWEHWNSLKKEVERLKGNASEECLCRDPMTIITDQDKELAQLRQEIQQSRDLIVWQQQCFQDQINQAEELPQDTTGSYFLEEQLQLQEAKALFARQQANFELERHRFTEAAIRLGHERRCFEQERAMFMKDWLLEQPPSHSQGNPQLCPDLSAPQTPEQELCPKNPGITLFSTSNQRLDRNPSGEKAYQDPPIYRLFKKLPGEMDILFNILYHFFFWKAFSNNQLFLCKR